jgi:hypothetical protein
VINSTATNAAYYGPTGDGGWDSTSPGPRSHSIFAGSLSGGSILAGSMSTGSIVAGSVVAGSMSTGSIVAGSIVVGSMSAGSIFAGSRSSGTTSVSHAWTNAITNVVGPTTSLQQSFGVTQGFVYRVPAVTWLDELKSARHSINEFALLQENWDGYGASPISDQVRQHAHHFINEIEAAPFEVPVPEVSPKPTGTISFGWEAPHAEVYIEIGNTRYSGFVKTEQQKPVFLQGHADSMDQQIVALIQSVIAAAPPSSAPTITEIRPQSQWWHERLAA